MIFLKLRLKNKKTCLVRMDLIASVVPDLKGSGSIIEIEASDRLFEVLETVEEVQELLLDTEIEADIVAND